MVQIPDQLAWELTRRNTSFLKKKNGHTARTGQVVFSVEKGNLTSMNLLKYSGLANSKVFDIVCTPENRAQVIKKTASKCHTQPKKSCAVIPVNKDFRRSERVICQQAIDNYYRPDLKAAALAKYTKVYQANRRAKGITKPVPCKKGRGTIN
jgi:large subunit ribosomal protein L28e